MALALTFFVFDYANTVRWQVQAQNAADSAAVALLAKDANAANSMTSLLYALSLQDFKVSTVNTALVNLVENKPFCPTDAVCSQSYSTLITDYTSYVGELPTIVHDVSLFIASLNNSVLTDQLGLGGMSQSAQNTYATGLLGALFKPTSGGTCLNVLTDCNFTYSVAVVTSSPLVVDVVACRQVPSLASGLLHLTNANFKAVGRSTVELSPLSNTVNTGALISGLGSYGQAAGIVSQIPLGGSLGNINLNNLQSLTGFLVPTPVSPLTTANIPC
jgi:hypothetical protein